jgi:hypothetical protein
MVIYQTYWVYDFIVTMIVKFDTRNDTRRGFGAVSNTLSSHLGVRFVPGC